MRARLSWGGVFLLHLMSLGDFGWDTWDGWEGWPSLTSWPLILQEANSGLFLWMLGSNRVRMDTMRTLET